MAELDASGVLRNWSGSFDCKPLRLERPRDEAGVAEAVRRAAGSGQRLRVVGAGHSGTPLVATDGVLLSLDALAGIESHDPGLCRATIRAGSRLHDLGDPLLALGMGMQNLGDIDVQALAGAIGTGTHGTGRSLGNLSSQVTAVRFVDAAGGLREVSRENDPETLRGLRVSLGALGVWVAVELQLCPAYRLHERIWREPVEACLEGLPAHVAGNRHFEFFWLPHKDVAEMKSLNPTEASPEEVASRPYERIGWSPHILPSVRDVKFFEMEYAIPAECGPECFRAVRERMQQRHPEVVWPVEYRTVAADDAYLSPAGGRETVTLSVHQDGTLPYREFFADVEPVFWEFGGRPHWGKIHGLGASRLRGLYPDWQRFADLRAALDPDGRFGNPHLEQVLQGD